MCKIKNLLGLVIVFAITVLSSCHINAKLDRFVAEQYGNKLPVPVKKKTDAANVNIGSTVSFSPEGSISVTSSKTVKMLPLVLYWYFDYRRTCNMNPAIAVSSFTSAVYQQSAKLNQKLNGRKLELTVEQLPHSFAFVDKTYYLLFLVHWDKLYVQPDINNMVVSYKVIQDGAASKTGSITINNEQGKQGIHFLQSWKSAANDAIASYNAEITNMSKSFVNKLLGEL